MRRMHRNEGALADSGIVFGRSRLAAGRKHTCLQCGMCLYGCPYGVIYSARTSLDDLLSDAGERLRYRPGLVVRRVREEGDRVVVESERRHDQRAVVDEAERVFLAGGVFSSTAIVLESLKRFDDPISLRQSDHFLLPMLLSERARGVENDRLHTLSQVFIELCDACISRHTVHLQLYTYNDFYWRLVRRRLGPLYPITRPALRPLIERLVLVKGYLHSDDSSVIEAQLEANDHRPLLRLRARHNPETQRTVRAVRDALRRHRKKTGAAPLPGGLRLGLPGSGAHVGGSFPMAKRRTQLQADLLGRPFPFRRVHVVDSSVFPTVPAPTLTLTTMANAHRIASHAAAASL